MKNKFLKLIACLLVAAMLASTCAYGIAAEENNSDAEVADSAVNTEEPTDSNTETEPIPDDENAPDDAAAPEGESIPDGNTASEDETVAEGDTAPDEEAPAEGETEPAPAPSDSEEEEEDVPHEFLTDADAIARCTVAAENDNFILYLDEQYERVGFYVKESGYVHWSNCINALSDDATSKPSLKESRLSNAAVKYGNTTDLITSSYLYSYRQSTDKEKTTFELVENGVKITYDFNGAKATVPVYFILEDEYLDVYINTKEIKERAGYKEGVSEDESTSDVIILTDIAILPYMSAATPQDNGYMFVPDGPGAAIKLNNGKSAYKNYSEYIYGRDITKVRENQADEVEQVYMPVMAMVKDNNGLVMIATEGDTFATANAAVAYNKQDQAGYNYCYFSFVLRSTDDYNMAGDSSSIIVFERGNGEIPVEKLAVRYYPITSEEEVVPYGDIAEVYRDYLIEEKGLTKKVENGYAPLFVDYFGGTLKSKSILGIPVDIKTAYTTFAQAIEISTKLKELGVDEMVVNYNDWTNDSMSDKIDTADSVAACLGGKSGYKKMLSYFADNGIEYYGTVDGITFKSGGNGFMTLFNTAYRVSKSYARPYEYNLAYGTPESGVAAALLAPKSVAKLSKKVSKNVGKLDMPGAGLGCVSSTLWSDFSTKNHTNRGTTAQYVIDYYKTVKEKTSAKKIIADAPNAYLLPYVDAIKNLSLQSSQFKIVDIDIPFVQMVLHGYTSYSTEAINGSADSQKLFLKAIAAGSNIHYDFIYNEATKLVNTDYVNLYYATYEGWLDQCAAEYKLANEILAPISGAVMLDYSIDGDVITTTYDNGTVTTVDLESGVITANGKTYNYSDYVDEGGLR